MKLCLHCGDKPRAKYENYDTRFEFAQNDNVNPSLDNYAFSELDKDSVEEILANIGSIESIRRDGLPGVVHRWFELLKPGAKIKIETFDIYMIVNNLLYDQIDLFQFEAINERMKSVHCYQEVKELFETHGFKFELGQYQGEYSSMIFSKPDDTSKE